MDLDLRALFGAVAGGALFGFVRFGALVKGGHDVTPKEYLDLVVNIACAVVCGILLTILLAKVVAPLVPIAALRDPQMVGCFFGMFGWELLPLVYTLVQNKAIKKAQALEGDR